MTTTEDKVGQTANLLLSADAVRERCDQVLAAAQSLEHFRIHWDRLDSAADYVVDTIRANYPDLDVPFHSRWRHFKLDGLDRWQAIASRLDLSKDELARTEFDLAITSVLLDAGAGAVWRYRDALTGKEVHRSEGLALASLDAFANGLFSSSSERPLQADAAGLQNITEDHLSRAFQVSSDNQLEGLSGRVKLMNRLGGTMQQNEQSFAGEVLRIGNLFDLIAEEHGDRIDAPSLLAIVIQALGDIWPGRLSIDGANLGDTWQHPAVCSNDATNGFVPFHKLSQWLTYSLIEPLQSAGICVSDINGLTGLAEYRNGGLFIDLGVLELRDPSAFKRLHKPSDTLIVEWRALTVALLDRIAVVIRGKLSKSLDDLPLASILEGGTWAAGRRIAAEHRPGATPPIRIASDGSVF